MGAMVGAGLRCLCDSLWTGIAIDRRLLRFGGHSKIVSYLFLAEGREGKIVRKNICGEEAATLIRIRDCHETVKRA